MLFRSACISGLALLALTAPVAAQTGGTGVGSQFELVFWQSVATSDDVGQYEAYLARYPEGTFAPLARAKIERLRPSALPARPTPAPAPALAALPPPPAVTAPPVSPTVAPLAVTPAPTVAVTPAPAPLAVPARAAAEAGPPPVTPQPATQQSVSQQPLASPATALPAIAATSAPAAASAEPSPGAPPSLAEQLAALAHSQGRAAETAPGTTTRELPAAPALPPADPVILPERFCSAVERNAFYDERFRPSKDAADENNRRAIAHLQTLQRLYDQLGAQGDPDGQNAVAAQSKAYQPVATAAYQTTAAYEQLFQRMMAVPILDCAPPAPAKGGRGS